jgi:hypothetical protein
MSNLNKKQVDYEFVNLYNTQEIDASEFCERITKESLDSNGKIMIGDIVFELLKYKV